MFPPAQRSHARNVAKPSEGFLQRKSAHFGEAALSPRCLQQRVADEILLIPRADPPPRSE